MKKSFTNPKINIDMFETTAITTLSDIAGATDAEKSVAATLGVNLDTEKNRYIFGL